MRRPVFVVLRRFREYHDGGYLWAFHGIFGTKGEALNAVRDSKELLDTDNFQIKEIPLKLSRSASMSDRLNKVVDDYVASGLTPIEFAGKVGMHVTNLYRALKIRGVAVKKVDKFNKDYKVART